ncbi:hypothetical protein MKQ70_33195 [Chitinophaga sedimenti]|uniref:hypothetical protein n=1 Tax=Chitinophaga sedimenti TaxID=2033606 RepID=UPI00200682D1|nr:hypothetical protein [Chitinophaga sedimenti]MCK7559550.1 hypothetical protein [Chitinophaga sedimenti]
MAEAYKGANQYAKAGDWYTKAPEAKLANKDQVSALDYYNPGNTYYFGSNGGTDTVTLNKAIAAFALLAEKYPDLTTGHYWVGKATAAKDVEAKSGIAKPYFEKYISMAEGEPAKNKAGLVTAYTYVMVYYYNVEDKAAMNAVIDKVTALDPENSVVKDIKAAEQNLCGFCKSGRCRRYQIKFTVTIPYESGAIALLSFLPLFVCST